MTQGPLLAILAWSAAAFQTVMLLRMRKSYKATRRATQLDIRRTRRWSYVAANAERRANQAHEDMNRLLSTDCLHCGRKPYRYGA